MAIGNESQATELWNHFMSAGILCFFLAAAVMGGWLAMGGEGITQYQVSTTEVIADEFGDEIETQVMKDEFQFGLLPDKGYDGAAPIGGGFAALGIGLLVFGFVRRNKLNESRFN